MKFLVNEIYLSSTKFNISSEQYLMMPVESEPKTGRIVIFALENNKLVQVG